MSKNISNAIEDLASSIEFGAAILGICLSNSILQFFIAVVLFALIFVSTLKALYDREKNDDKSDPQIS